MVIRGTIKNGKVQLDDPNALAEGTKVEVRPLKKKTKAKPSKAKRGSLAERLAPFIGKAKHLPADMSANLDHYLYGTPKRK